MRKFDPCASPLHQPLVFRQTAYTAYGSRNPLVRPGASVAFAGEHVDRHTDGYVLGNGYRLYSPALMRFCSADNLSPFENGGLNPYAYCSGDPINATDQSGHFPLPNHSKFETYAGQGKQWSWGGAYLAKHPKNRGKAITVIAHGQLNSLSTHSPESIVKALNSARFNTQKYDIHFIVCGLADESLVDMSPPFTQSVANITQRATYGYQGRVWVVREPPKHMAPGVKGRDTLFSVTVLKDQTANAQATPFNYSPVVSHPSSIQIRRHWWFRLNGLIGQARQSRAGISSNP